MRNDAFNLQPGGRTVCHSLKRGLQEMNPHTDGAVCLQPSRCAAGIFFSKAIKVGSCRSKRAHLMCDVCGLRGFLKLFDHLTSRSDGAQLNSAEKVQTVSDVLCISLY